MPARAGFHNCGSVWTRMSSQPQDEDHRRAGSHAYGPGFARNLRVRAARGAAWHMAGRFADQAIRLGVQLVLVRLLAPEDFGLLGMAMVVMAFAVVLRDSGLPAAVIQRKEIDDVQLSSAFWLNAGIGLLLSVALAAGAPLAAAFYGRPQVASILAALAGSVALESLYQLPTAMLRRELDFRRLALGGTACGVVAGAAAIAMALAGFGVWSLVARVLIDRALRAAVFWSITGWRPRVVFSFAGVKPLLTYGLPLLGFALLNFCNKQFDYLIVGKVLGPKALGYYTVAYLMVFMPITQVAQTLCEVAFPILSAAQENRQRVAALYLRMVRLLTTITFPMMTGLAALAPVAIPWAFGQRWAPVVRPVQVFAVLGMLQSVYTTGGLVYRSTGHTKAQLRLMILFTPLIVGSFAVGVQWGVLGVCVAYCVALAVVSPVWLRTAMTLVN